MNRMWRLAFFPRVGSSAPAVGPHAGPQWVRRREPTKPGLAATNPRLDGILQQAAGGIAGETQRGVQRGAVTAVAAVTPTGWASFLKGFRHSSPTCLRARMRRVRAAGQTKSAC